MRIDFLTCDGSDRLILIFAGWSTDAALYAHIAVPGWDVAVVSGDDLLPPDWSSVAAYGTIYLYAWSMGVHFAMRLLPEEIQPVACYALNGTPLPCHDTLGIPRNIFLGTADGLTPRSLEKFRMRMCGSSALYRELAGRFTEVNTERLASQLREVAAYSGPLRKLPWRAAYVSEDDRIFPPENQRRAWNGVAEIRSLEGAHYADLGDILRLTVFDTGRVGSRFSRSMDTYTQHAHAQRMIAERLASMLSERVQEARIDSLIEIGCGTGLFTYAWSRLLTARKAHFMDLCELPRFGVSEEEQYTTGDAERGIKELAAEAPGSVDAIVSASAIQWFSNPAAFLRDCLRLLRPGGVLAVSTFAPGNLPELHGLRPDPMHYPSAEELRDYLKDFSEVSVFQENVEIDFTTPLEALRHLRLTGVTGSGAQAGAAGIRRFAANYPVNERGRYSLTFKPIYLLARRGFSRLDRKI